MALSIVGLNVVFAVAVIRLMALAEAGNVTHSGTVASGGQAALRSCGGYQASVWLALVQLRWDGLVRGAGVSEGAEDPPVDGPEFAVSEGGRWACGDGVSQWTKVLQEGAVHVASTLDVV